MQSNHLQRSLVNAIKLLHNWSALRHLATNAASDSAFSPLPRKQRAPGNARIGFCDAASVSCEAGNGGDGMISFNRIFCNPLAGPGGGDGGNGGHVLLNCTNCVRDLGQLPRLARAQSGANGASVGCTGRNGSHLQLSVPPGTQIYNSANVLLGELSRSGEVFVAARGGAGGKGNAFFLSNSNRAPKMAERGGRGEQRQLQLRLSVLADVGLVGLPNAGKSSLLRCVSRARPKVANYAFTTLHPHVGVAQFADFSVSIADIPGLIDGAHANRGLGHDFLHHIARCACLIYVIDLGAIDPVGQYETLRSELDLFSPGLSSSVKLLLANKSDLSYSDDNYRLLIDCAGTDDLEIMQISAKTGANVKQLLAFLYNQFNYRAD